MTYKAFATLLRTILAATVCLFALNSVALDKNGNFESVQEQDAFIAATLKKTAGEMNSQAPIQVDKDTRMISVFALQKTLNFNVELINFRASQLDPRDIEQAAKENLNHTVCKSEATRNLIDLGVKYIYRYVGNDGKLITKVGIDRYRC